MVYLKQVEQRIAQRFGEQCKYPESVELMNIEFAQELADWYLLKLQEHFSGKQRVTDKMPENFLRLGLFCKTFSQGADYPLPAPPSGYCNFHLFSQL